MANRLSGLLAVSLALGLAGCGGDSLTLPPTTGTLEITATTTGPAPDADGYAISLDGTEQGAIGSNAVVTVPNLAPGSHVAGLTGVDANCQVQGDNLRVITVEAGSTVQLTFAVSCAEPPPVVGVLRVTTTTTGQDIDADGYGFAVDGGASQPIGVNASTDLANTAVGAHTVALSNVAANCTVDDASQGTIVPPGGIATVAFRITCGTVGPTTGSIRVTTVTTGPNQDSDGYQFSVDGGTAQTIGVSDNKTVAGLAPGPHTVALSGLAANCSVNDDNQGVAVTAGQTEPVNFSITCTATGPTTGSIRVTTATTGDNQDPDGYQFQIDNGSDQPIGLNGSQTVDGISPGSHTVELKGAAANCTINDDQQGVTVTAGQTAPVNFSIACTSTAPSASRSEVQDGGDFTAGGGTTISVRVRDSRGDPLSGVAVSLSSTGTGNTITPTSATTDGNGLASFTFSSTVAERKVVTATAGGVVIEDQATIDVVRAPAVVSIVDDPDPTVSGTPFRVTVTVTSGENGGTPTGTVNVFSDVTNTPCGTGSLTLDQNGQASCDMALAENENVIATYSGDQRFEDNFASESHTVQPAVVGQAPTSTDDAFTTPGGGQPLTVSGAVGVLTNDSDPDPGTTLTAINASSPVNGGTLVLGTDGGFTYTPPPGYSGPDSFSYEASDGSLASSPATVTITVIP